MSPFFEYMPSGHSAVFEPAQEYPEGQVEEQVVEPGAEYLEATQSKQVAEEVAAVAVECVPAPHGYCTPLLQ